MKKLIDEIKKYEYVSFDMFDTVILRNVYSSSDIFKIVQKLLEKENVNINDFYSKRIIAEKKAVVNSKCEEITIEEIYDNIEFKSAEDRHCAMNMEKDVEIRYSAQNIEFAKVLDYCIEHNKKILIATDMYLDESTIQKILQKNKIHYDYLFLSSKIKLRKSRGRMFGYILNELDIKKNEIIHIGDNIKSDYIIPKSKGIRSVLYKSHKHDCRNINNLTDNVCLSYINNNENHDDKYYDFGFRYLGILIYGMCQWIHDEADINKISNIYFISRDGYILKKAYDIIYSDENTNYLYLSRRSLTVPMLKDMNSVEEIMRTITYIKRSENIEMLLHKLGIEDKEVIAECRNRYGERIRRADLTDGRYNELYSDIKDIVKKNAEEEFENCAGYLKNNIAEGKIMIVDLGWYGTIQRCLTDILNEIGLNCKIYGYYLGVLKKNNVECYESNIAKGYIYDYKNDSVSMFDRNLIFGFNGLIESIFTADHGSVKTYKKENEKYKPVLESFKNQNWDVISRIHEGALDFVRGVNDLINENRICISKETAFNGLNRFCTRPSKEDVEMFQNVIFYDAYYEKLVKYQGFFKYIRNFRLMIDDFSVSNWKIGFLKRLIKINVPIDKMYLLLNSLK